MGNETSPTEGYTLSQIDHELKQFYRFAKENHLTDEEIAKICQPLTQLIKKPTFTLNQLRILATFLAILVFAVFAIFYFETAAWHASAVGRILMVNLLPIWNWSELKNSKCLVSYPSSNQASEPIECTFCEFIDKIDAAEILDSQILSDKFIKLHRPIILENALEKWQAQVRNDVIAAIMDDPILSESIPCKLSTNIFIGSEKLKRILNNIDLEDTYFIHFENCNFEAVKAFRKFFPRPGFLIPEISPVQYSWLLASNKYRVGKFKQLELREQVTVVGQILGKNMFMLVPRSDCVDECNSLAVELAAGEALVFSSYWNLEYKPDPDGENLAIILEAHY